MGLGQDFAGLMMIDDDGGKAQFRRMGERIMGHHSAIEGEEEFGALAVELAHGAGARSVALGQPVGNVDSRRASRRVEEERQKRGGTDAVDIIVADDADPLAPDDGVSKTACPLLHVEESRWLRHQGSKRRVEIGFDLLEGNTAGGQDAAENIGKIMALADRLGQPRILEARLPAAAGYRTGNVQEAALHRLTAVRS